jgi:hypothetical protein
VGGYPPAGALRPLGTFAQHKLEIVQCHAHLNKGVPMIGISGTNDRNSGTNDWNKRYQ